MTDKPLQIRNSTAEFLIFTAQAGEQGIEVRYADETVWLTQKMMAELFQISIPAISQHLKNIFESNELERDSVVKKFLTTVADGKSYNTRFYSLDAIISVGYRVNSVRATREVPCRPGPALRERLRPGACAHRTRGGQKGQRRWPRMTRPQRTSSSTNATTSRNPFWTTISSRTTATCSACCWRHR